MTAKNEGELIYSMPLKKYQKMQASLKLLFGGILIPFIIIFVIAFQSILLSLRAGLLAFICVGGIIFVLSIISTPLTVHDPLIIYENALIPLRRPFRSTREKILYIRDIFKIEFEGMNGAENEIYEFDIYDKQGNKYQVNSLVLSRYDPSEKSCKIVYDALNALKEKVEKNAK